MKKIFNIYEWLVVFAAVFYLGYTYAPKQEIVIDFKPIYRDAIKAVDPFEYFKEGMSPEDFANY